MIYVGIDIAKLNHFVSPFLQTMKYSLTRFNALITMMASICCFPNWHHLTRTASS